MAQHNTSQGFLTSISENYISPSILLQKELPNILMYDPLVAHVELLRDWTLEMLSVYLNKRN